MNKTLLKLQRDIIDGAPKNHQPYDRYAYKSFAWTAQDLSYHAKSEDERQLCLWLKAKAIEKSNAMLAQESAS